MFYALNEKVNNVETKFCVRIGYNNTKGFDTAVKNVNQYNS